MKLYKLIVHTKTFSVEDLIINPKDFPTLQKGDVVEIYHPEDEFSRLLLQINSFKEDLQGRETISVEQSIATTFQLRTYADVIVNKVDPMKVALDSVELTFKDQYMGRSEMWRLKSNMVNTCVYLHKKIEFCGGSNRCQVYEMWASGDKVACGVINEDTKVVFRSSTSMVYIFIQMSSEMWDFDIHGDIYFEKAIHGFMTELFAKWKKIGTNHEVTIVMYSRVFYTATTTADFPKYMLESVQQDYKGRFYEDFYRVIIQNERYDDWSNILTQLKRRFTGYQESILKHHKRTGTEIPVAMISSSDQGSFLEVLNISLNVFEKHYMERSLERTGQLVVVLSPGVGVFDVDRELTNVTKQRIIDNGVGCDVVCVGQQPLHAVPLLRFHNKDPAKYADDYSLPHWINLSFYSSNKKVAYSSFIPRIKVPPGVLEPKPPGTVRPRFLFLDDDRPTPTTVEEMDAYDAQVFASLSQTSSKANRLVKKTSVSTLEGSASSKMTKRKTSDPDIHYVEGSGSPPLTPVAPTASARSEDDSSTLLNTPGDAGKSRGGDVAEGETRPAGATVGSPGTQGYGAYPPILRPGRSLINPFDPSHVTIKITSNRRRWSHVFPKGPNGQLIQHHHYQAGPSNDPPTNSAPSDQERVARSASQANFSDRHRPSVPGQPVTPGTRKTLLWGATGEQEWTPELITGVDWKSLVIPACLPITTDYFPDEVCLKTDYVFSDYNLLPDDVNADYAQQRAIYRKPLSTPEVFRELVSQRLAQGFQIIEDGLGVSGGGVGQVGSAVVGPRPADIQPSTEYRLSIGRVFHRITLCGSEIRVTRYRPRHPYPPFSVPYRYRFQAPDHQTFEMSWVTFDTEKLETYNWNYLDHYICTRGDSDFALSDSLKYWRFRVYILPVSTISTRRILEGSEYCDLYSPLTQEEQEHISDNYLRFIETWINKIRRPSQKKPRGKHGRMMYRQSHTRSGSKVMDRGRASPATDSTSLTSSTADSEHSDSVEDTLSVPGDTLLLKETATPQEIVEAMKHPVYGLSFLSPHASLPGHVFVSSDAVSWAITHMEHITSYEAAVKLMEDLRQQKLISHASGDAKRPFIVGFHLYHIVNYDPNKDEPKPLKDLQSFESEWLEVEMKPPTAPPAVPLFLSDSLPTQCRGSAGPHYRHTHLEIDAQTKSDRVEWAHCRYQSVYRPDHAYELVVQWVAASGTIVNELISGWARKAQSNGLLMIPIPPDPFALPCSIKSEVVRGDPLRGPVFVPLDTESLMGTKSYLFEEFPEESWGQRLILFQEAIAVKFGFIACSVESSSHYHHHQYIHLTGNVFLMIPAMPCDTTRSSLNASSAPRSVNRYPTYSDVKASPHHEYITRYNTAETKVGFLWSWNHMISRRWKWTSAPAKSDEAFQNKLLSDFRNFCSNSDNRLKSFWDACWAVPR
uniref:DEP domain-containing protein n=1 Tax=Cuerna arida TaxID=1464854 RepID=A0A1B6F1V2_9HEMI